MSMENGSKDMLGKVKNYVDDQIKKMTPDLSNYPSMEEMVMADNNLRDYIQVQLTDLRDTQDDILKRLAALENTKGAK